MALDARDRKQTGSYFTSREIADFLAAVAIDQPSDRVLEPCFGEGVFLEACHSRLGSGGKMVGVDVNADLVAEGRARFPYASLVAADFFECSPKTLGGTFDAVIGNPPFVRYHRFNGQQRSRALERAAAANVAVSALTSSWVPFLIHASQHLAEHGRMCVVAPFEITYARYARPFVAYLCEQFKAVRLLVFDEPLFPELNEKTVLLLADGWGGECSSVHIVHARAIRDLDAKSIFSAQAEEVPAVWNEDAGRANLYRLDARARDLFLALEQRVPRLGDLADITIGYVTGNNKWFHLTSDEVRLLGLAGDVRLVLRKGMDLRRRGLALDVQDEEQLALEGAHWLFDPSEPLGEAASARIRDGEDAQAHSTYKCRVRTPWWRVPGVRSHHLVVGVFSTLGPRLVATSRPATNSLLVADLREPVRATTVAASALTSLAQLSAEVNGHALGGGALKLEPAEVRRWSLPVFDEVPSSAIEEIHRALKDGEIELASMVANQVFLRQLGITPEDVEILRQATRMLREARLRSSAHSAERRAPSI